MGQPAVSRCRPWIAVTAGMMLLALGACGRSDASSQRGDTAPEARWATHLGTVDAALAKKDFRAAERAWHRAYGEARGMRGWRGLLAVGDAAVKIGSVAEAAQAFGPKAREAYLATLFSAHELGSVEGLVLTAEAFAAMGDAEMADRSIAAAHQLIDRGRALESPRRAAELLERFSARFSAAGGVARRSL